MLPHSSFLLFLADSDVFLWIKGTSLILKKKKKILHLLLLLLLFWRFYYYYYILDHGIKVMFHLLKKKWY